LLALYTHPAFSLSVLLNDTLCYSTSTTISESCIQVSQVATSLSHTHRRTPLCLPLPLLTHLLAFPSASPRRRPLWRGRSSAAAEAAPLCLARAAAQEILSQQEKAAERLSAGRPGRTVQAQTQRYNVELSRPSEKPPQVEKLFQQLSSPCAEAPAPV